MDTVKKAALAAGGVLILALLLFSGMGSRTSLPDTEWHTIGTGPLTLWSVYDGQIASRTVHTVLSRLNGSAHVTYLSEEGAPVAAGDPIVHFDSAALERELVRLQRDVTLAETELQSLKEARHPLQLRALELALDEARAVFDAEALFLEDSKKLVEEGLISAFELEQQETAVEQARVKRESAKEQVHLTSTVLHPSEARHAEARLESARLEYEMAQEQLAQCTLTAPSSGVVVHVPLHVGGEFRVVRVGDEVFKNQPFMAIHDMNDLVVQCDVPEADLSRIPQGGRTEVIPLAFQDLHLEGAVERIGSTARTQSGRPRWQRYFQVAVGLQDNDPRLRTGMSVQVNVLSYHADNAIRIPRTAVWWEEGVPYCHVQKDRRPKVRQLSLGRANDQFYEVHGGLAAGDTVALDL